MFKVESIKPSSREIRLKSELQRAKDVPAEITSLNVELKKGALGLEDYWKFPWKMYAEVQGVVEINKGELACL